jgi:hypothetical protein
MGTFSLCKRGDIIALLQHAACAVAGLRTAPRGTATRDEAEAGSRLRRGRDRP